MKIGIIGCGWLGTRVAQKLENENEIFVTTRSDENTSDLKKLSSFQLLKRRFFLMKILN